MKDLEHIRSLLSAEGIAREKCLSSLLDLPWFIPPIVEGRRLNDKAPHYTMVVPIFNQEQIILRFFREHFAHCDLPHDLIVIFDCCSDDSRNAFRQTLGELNAPQLCSIVEIVTSVPYFETACDNIGFIIADTEEIIEFQPDLILGTTGYDARLLAVLRQKGVFSVSGRCGHSLRAVYREPLWPLSYFYRRKDMATRVGLHGRLIESVGFDVDDTDTTAYFCETVNRGPIAFRQRDLAELGFLDQVNFFLGDDDHDLNLRAWLSKGLLPAYVPIKVRSNLSDGSTRKPRDSLNAEIYAKLLQRPNNSVLKRFERVYKPYCSPTAFHFERERS
jgi:GT2 family glycosyltransferase